MQLGGTINICLKKKAETETHSESPINHFKAYVFVEIKRISQEIYLVKSVEDAARWNNQHLDDEKGLVLTAQVIQPC